MSCPGVCFRECVQDVLQQVLILCTAIYRLLICMYTIFGWTTFYGIVLYVFRLTNTLTN